MTLKVNGKTRDCLHTTQDSLLVVLTLGLVVLLKMSYNMPNSVREKWRKIEATIARSYYLFPPDGN